MVLAASTGGHLAQLLRMAPALDPTADSLWVTFKSPQSETLLAGRRTLYVPYIAPRDWQGIAKAFRAILKETRGRAYDLCVSTGAGIALAAIPAMRTQGTHGLYIESVSRVRGPSLTGRVLAASRLCNLRTQHQRWAVRPSEPSCLDEFIPK
jgi:UDP-N-acetylglucosamine--N-acetylmuramyl-(pentapeptide) pyrophosphoryl-undecaprenol N-acetylglucosamine transferase